MVPEGYEPSKPIVIVSSAFLGALLIYFVYLQTKRYLAFSGEVRYTIGIITDRYIQSSGRDISYSYRVNDSTYRGDAGYAYKSRVGNKYWIKYSVEYPDITKIYQNRPVDARIDSLPPDGFERMYNYEQYLKWQKTLAN